MERIYNTDINIGKSYYLQVMSLKELRDRIMQDNNLTDIEIFSHYNLSKNDKFLEIPGHCYTRSSKYIAA